MTCWVIHNTRGDVLFDVSYKHLYRTLEIGSAKFGNSPAWAFLDITVSVPQSGHLQSTKPLNSRRSDP